MKILLISPIPPPVGGIASWTVTVLKYFNENNKGVKIFHIDSSLIKDKIVNRNLFDRYVDGIKGFFSIYKKLSDAIRKYHPDLVHITSSASLALFKDYILIRKCNRLKCQCVIHFRFGRIPQIKGKDNWEWKLLKKVIRRADKCIVIDKESFNTLRDFGFDNIYYLPNPVSSDFENASKQMPLNQNRETGTVLFVGHVRKEKGVIDLAEACYQLPVVKELHIVGPCDNEIKERLNVIGSLREDQWMHLLGVRNKNFIIEEMRKCSLFVLPSYTEGFPNVIIEAMIMACPIIATNVGDISEMLQFHSDKKVGIEVPVGNVQVMKGVICALLNDSKKAVLLGIEARQRAMQNYTMELVSNQLITIWNKQYLF